MGQGNPLFKANLGIKDEKILKISRRPLEAETNIDASRLIVCPGFLDLHSHSDFSIPVHKQAKSSLHMRLTTMGIGQCGQDVYNLNEMTKSLIQQTIASFSLVPL